MQPLTENIALTTYFYHLIINSVNLKGYNIFNMAPNVLLFAC